MLLTDWTRIGLSGATVDGREIKAEWLEQAAKNYNTDTYTANINYEHRSWYGNFGQVQELKTAKENGKTALYARVRPDANLLVLNKREGDKLFTSMEIRPKFSDTGEAYLTGLALTDDPASLGTQQFNFSKEDDSVKPVIYVAEACEVGKFSIDQGQDENELNLFKKMAKKLGFSVVEKTEDDETPSEATQLFTQLKETIESIKAPDLTKLFSKDAGEKLQQDYTALKEANDTLKTEHDTLKEKFTELDARVADALKEKPVDDPKDNPGAAEDFEQCW